MEMPEKMKQTAQKLLAEAFNADARFRMYVQGCMDGLGLEGDWNLDTNAWTFTEMPKTEMPKSEES